MTVTKPFFSRSGAMFYGLSSDAKPTSGIGLIADATTKMNDADAAAKPPADPIEAMEPKWRYDTVKEEHCLIGEDGLKLFAIKRDADGNAILTLFDALGFGVSGVKSGTYTGDDTTSQAVTGIGFKPKYVKIWPRNTTHGAANLIFETTDTIIDDHADGMAVVHENAGNIHRVSVNAIVSLDADGFTVDDNGGNYHPNKNGSIYNYLAMG